MDQGSDRGHRGLSALTTAGTCSTARKSDHSGCTLTLLVPPDSGEHFLLLDKTVNRQCTFSNCLLCGSLSVFSHKWKCVP